MKLGTQEMSVCPSGSVIGYYGIKTNEATEITRAELSVIDYQKDKAGRYYIQKGGQKRVYLDNAIIVDLPNAPTVKEYLENTKPKMFDVEIKLSISDEALDESDARAKALKMLRGLQCDFDNYDVVVKVSNK